MKDNKEEECNKVCRSKIARWVLLSVLLSTLMTGCSAMQGIGSALSLAGGSAPSVEATAQVGKENNTEGDAVVSNRRVEDSSVDVKDTGVSNVKQLKAGVSSDGWEAETLSVQNVISNVPPIFLFLFALGWVLPGPIDILRGVGKSLLFLRDLVTMRI